MKAELYKAIFDHIKNAVIIAGQERIIDTNRAFLNLFRLSSKEELFDNQYYFDVVKNSLADKEKRYNSILDTGGSEVLVEITASLIDPENKVYLLEITPIDDESLYNEITMLSTYNREMFNNSLDAIVILNNDSTIIDINIAFEKLFEYSRSEALGRDIDELIVENSEWDEGKKLFQRVLNNERVEVSARRYTRSGESVDVAITGYPIVIDNRTRGNCVIYKDISREIQKDRLLKEKEEFLNQLFNKSLYPIAILDKEEKVLDINLEFEKIFGYKKEEMLNKKINLFIVPEGYAKESTKFLEKILKKETMMKKTKRKNKRGELIDVEAVGSPVIINNEVVGMFAMYRDSRTEVKALNELQKERAYFKQLFDNSPDPIAILDSKDRIVDFNKPFEEVFGYRLEETKGRYINDLIVSKPYLEESTRNTWLVVEEGESLKLETVRTSKEGRDIEVEIIAFPVFLDQDQLGAYAIYRDISERKNKEREIKNLLYKDALTGTYNRMYAYENLAERLKEAGDNIVTILYVDLDDFKKVNDAKGHIIGDKLLTQAGNRIKDHFEGKMLICRVGGDEFLGIVTTPAPASTEALIDELKKLFDQEFVLEGESFKLGLSVGYASYPEDGRDVDQLITRADTRMYREKKINRIKRYPYRKTKTVEDIMRENNDN